MRSWASMAVMRRKKMRAFPPPCRHWAAPFAGVNTYNYGCFASLVLGGNAQALMVGTDHSQVMMGYQTVGAGSIFLITDQNVWDNVYASSNDNKVMIENLLSATVVPSVPEPETYAMLLAGLGLMGAVARRRKAKQA